MSALSKGSPHSGQNFGGFFGSAGSQPHLSHLYNGASAGFFCPHSLQNLPLFFAPQEQVQKLDCSAGLGLPHSLQNFPVLPAAPQLQVQPALGFLLPHSVQNLPSLTAPQAHFQPC